MKFAGQSIGSSQFGASTFLASAHPSESCGSNGLPLTPNSIRIIGHAQELFKVSHPNLCSYIDILRGKHERIVVVQEFYSSNLKSAVDQNEEMRTESFLTKMMYEVLQGIVYLNDFGTVCRNLSPSAILIDPSGSAKLYGYGLYYMTESGSTISFPIGIPKYLPPEVLASDFQTTVSAFSSSMLSVCGNPVWDTWSLGIIVLETLLNLTLFDSCNVYEIVENILSMAYCSEKLFLDELITYHRCQAQFDNLSSGMKQFLSECLTVNVEHRPIPRDILGHSIFSDFGTKKLTNRHQMFGSERDHLADQNIRMVYHWWRLAGGNVEQELKKQKLIQNVPSILSLPRVVLKEGEVFGGAFVNRDYCSPSTIVLNLSNLRKKLSHVPAEDFYPLVTQEQNENDETCALNLPLVIREKDVVYQFKRMILFERLLRASPYKLERLRSEAEKDIPPYFRGQIWASLLGLPNGGLPNGGFVKERYEEIDKETQTPTDRQIEVDIPRCHQYDELLSSPTGHAKFTRILKAWVVSHPHLVYWQGLDSLCAPFLYLNFQNEGLAYACLSAFISKYLKGFFLKDNSAIIQDYLARFSHLIAFHNPHLFMHLHRIGFVPELYAIPWFLTMFTHVFPLQKIFVLWDTLLLGNSSLPLCFGVAILFQLRDRLLQFGFNECILLFSDMPDIDMEKVVNEAVDLFNSTPASLVHCRNSNSRSEKTQNFTENNEEFEEVDVSLTELKNELCGRINGGDLLNLMSRKNIKVLPLDIRSSEEFGRGALANSMSVPYDSLISTQDEISEEVFSKVANSSKGKIIVVIGSSRCFCQVVKVAEMLLSKGLQRICVLHKGIEVFRGSGYLIVT